MGQTRLSDGLERIVKSGRKIGKNDGVGKDKGGSSLLSKNVFQRKDSTAGTGQGMPGYWVEILVVIIKARSTHS